MTEKTANTSPSRVALVTGGSQGLGLALTRELVSRGWHVVTDARNGERLRAAVTGLGDAVTAVPGDVTDAAHRAELVAAAAGAGGLDLLVHNASALGASPLPTLTVYPADTLHEVFATNVVAPVALTAQAIRLLTAASPDGRRPVVLAISSDAAVEAYEGWGGYGASKAALDHVAQVLAVEHPDLTVYAVDPGDLRTQMHQDAFPGQDISDRPLPSTVAPTLVDLVTSGRPSGRYRAADLALETGRQVSA
ncbi:SDR family NAD(P)-dependent oxidoreductase [Angustibacter luteus]|uniref:SDR family NAD(P)-dependent oxidoreductase n=1 Tax=Angustibacter luteus TaxID=658456 RepID=A0ABW1JE90_9ACTN